MPILRDPKPPKKNKIINLRVTENEHKQIKAAAKKKGYTITKFIAGLVFDNVGDEKK